MITGQSKYPLDPTTVLSNTGADTATARTTTASTTSAKKTADTAKTIGKWELNASNARGMLGRLLDTIHLEHYVAVYDPKELWYKLEKRYSVKDQASTWFLREE
ncbi:hypothetical protein B9Z19DRAFT_1067833 [Tuber borchii]|uniref:Uncharacterized protein n=1 Tax=Tuber borchii TaxID=42251 RepID=A0A2T6ZHG6_TUBBO|nr:hypothetical protein B9Z19DRAFT_1067833 [Tuber borchii]